VPLYHGQAFPVPKINKNTLIKEVERLVTWGIGAAASIGMGWPFVYNTKET
jgi:hypothetical protein